MRQQSKLVAEVSKVEGEMVLNWINELYKRVDALEDDYREGMNQLATDMAAMKRNYEALLNLKQLETKAEVTLRATSE